MTDHRWLPVDFEHPSRVPVDAGHHLRPIRAADVDLDMPAVMGSRERLWSIYGEAWGWPPAAMTHEQDREDLEYHEREMELKQSFNYALLDTDETVLLGCVYIDPPTRVGPDAEVSWWVVDDLVGSDLAAMLDALVPTWLAEAWPFRAPCLIGVETTWADYLARPTLDTTRSADPES